MHQLRGRELSGHLGRAQLPALQRGVGVPCERGRCGERVHSREVLGRRRLELHELLPGQVPERPGRARLLALRLGLLPRRSGRGRLRGLPLGLRMRSRGLVQSRQPRVRPGHLRWVLVRALHWLRRGQLPERLGQRHVQSLRGWPVPSCDGLDELRGLRRGNVLSGWRSRPDRMSCRRFLRKLCGSVCQLPHRRVNSSFGPHLATFLLLLDFFIFSLPNFYNYLFLLSRWCFFPHIQLLEFFPNPLSWSPFRHQWIFTFLLVL